jgi:hypothetical protein
MIKAKLDRPYDRDKQDYKEDYSLEVSGLTLEESIELLNMIQSQINLREKKKDEHAGL